MKSTLLGIAIGTILISTIFIFLLGIKTAATLIAEEYTVIDLRFKERMLSIETPCDEFNRCYITPEQSRFLKDKLCSGE